MTVTVFPVPLRSGARVVSPFLSGAVFPCCSSHVSVELTNSVDNTITNILEGKVPSESLEPAPPSAATVRCCAVHSPWLYCVLGTESNNVGLQKFRGVVWKLAASPCIGRVVCLREYVSIGACCDYWPYCHYDN